MADPSRFALSPRTEFADRLEADLLRAIGDSTTSTTTPDGVRRRHLDEEHLMTVIDTESFDEQTGRRHRGWMPALAAAAAVVLVIAGVWVMRRADDQATAGRDVAFTVRWASAAQFNDCPTDVEVPVCAGTLPRPATATFTGDIAGNAYQSVVAGDSDDFADRAVRHEDKVATYVVDGTVSGCGTGQFVLVETLQVVSGPDRDYSTGTFGGTWFIVADSGRGDLRDIAGSGTSSGPASETDRELTGSITCTSLPDLSADEIIAPLGSYEVPTNRAAITSDGGDLPDGTYRAEFTAGDLDYLEPDVVHDFAEGGAIELTLDDGSYTLQRLLPSGVRDGGPVRGIYRVEGEVVIWTLPESGAIPGTDGINVFEWTVEGDVLTFTQVDGKHRDPWFAVPYTRVP